jgi:hypothetical protein
MAKIVQGSHMKNGRPMGFYKIVEDGRDIEFYYYEIANSEDRRRALRKTREELRSMGETPGPRYG